MTVEWLNGNIIVHNFSSLNHEEWSTNEAWIKTPTLLHNPHSTGLAHDAARGLSNGLQVDEKKVSALKCAPHHSEIKTNANPCTNDLRALDWR